MDFANRNRRLKEFSLWFEFKYGLEKSPVTTEGAQRVIDQTVYLQRLLRKHKPTCYWCNEILIPNLVQVDEDKLTIHHIDEDRRHNTVDNLDLCHKGCHQTMHKRAMSINVPTAILWASVYNQPRSPGVKLGVEIPGIGRGA